ncbi:unnamed protein product, partial [Urochloa humidicola]
CVARRGLGALVAGARAGRRAGGVVWQRRPGEPLVARLCCWRPLPAVAAARVEAGRASRLCVVAVVAILR